MYFNQKANKNFQESLSLTKIVELTPLLHLIMVSI